MRKPTDDERAGMAWWNSLSIKERERWLEHAGMQWGTWHVSPADAWQSFKALRGIAAVNRMNDMERACERVAGVLRNWPTA